MANNYSRADLCPVGFIAEDATARALGIVSEEIEMSVELWDAQNGSTGGNEAYLGGKGMLKGSIVAVYDLDAQPAVKMDPNAPGGAPPNIIAGRRGRLICALTGAAILPPAVGVGNIPGDGPGVGALPNVLALQGPLIAVATANAVAAAEAIPQTQYIGLPVRIRAVRTSWALEKAVGWAFDIVGDFLGDNGNPRFVTMPNPLAGVQQIVQALIGNLL